MSGDGAGTEYESSLDGLADQVINRARFREEVQAEAGLEAKTERDPVMDRLADQYLNRTKIREDGSSSKFGTTQQFQLADRLREKQKRGQLFENPRYVSLSIHFVLIDLLTYSSNPSSEFPWSD